MEDGPPSINPELMPITGYEGRYEVSSDGDIFSCVRTTRSGKNSHKTHPRLKMRQNFNKRIGYLSIALWKNNHCRTHPVHRLVALAFVKNSDPLIRNEVDHIDRNRTNNRAINLRWVTHAGNHLNRGKPKRGTNIHTGVRWCKQRLKWVAFLRRKNLGRFDTIEAAIRARNAAFAEVAAIEL